MTALPSVAPVANLSIARQRRGCHASRHAWVQGRLMFEPDALPSTGMRQQLADDPPPWIASGDDDALQGDRA